MENVCCSGKERTTYRHVSVQRSEAYHDGGRLWHSHETERHSAKGRTTCRDSSTAKPSTGLVPSEESHTQDAPKPRREILEKAKSRGQKSDHWLPDVRLWGKELNRNRQEVTLGRVVEYITVS